LLPECGLNILALAAAGTVQGLMETAFYPALLAILVLASLGLPIPEDVPLLVAGVILQTHEGVATWPGAITVSLIGIMVGDLVLYSMGKRWGRDVVRHRWVRTMITAERFDKMAARFHRNGLWMCFCGRFIMGVRAMMCITAGATRFPYWKFFLADFVGALISVPAFIFLGYRFAGVLPTLRRTLGQAQWLVVALVAVVVLAYVLYEWRKIKRVRLINIEYDRTHPPASGDPAETGAAGAKPRIAKRRKGPPAPRPRLSPEKP
jgi:membrane protein DedA with SNARE-associated domain